MKTFDYEKFIDTCEFGYELQKHGDYVPVIKIKGVKESFFGKPTDLKWYHHLEFMKHIYNKLDIKSSFVYMLDNLEFNRNVDKCKLFIVKSIYPDSWATMYYSGDPVIWPSIHWKITHEYFSIEEYKKKIKESVSHWIEVAKRDEQRELIQKQEEQAALDKFNENPYHFIRCE